MLVAVPSYKRFETLRWSLISVFKGRFDVSDSKRLVLVNNDPGSNQDAETLLKEIVTSEPAAKDWETIFIGRNPTMTPAMSWFEALKAHANEGETTLIHGDDDICLPGSLEARARALLGSGCSFLISRHQGRLVFCSGDRFHSPPIPPPIPSGLSGSGEGDPDFGNAAFIGNNTYRFDSDFRETLETAISYTERQDWLSEHERTLMLPYYLPLVAIHLGKKVVGLPTVCELRGSSKDDLVNHPYQHPSWNSGFFYGVVLDFLCSSPLGTDGRFEGERDHHKNLTAHWFLAVLSDKRIPENLRRNWAEINRPRVQDFRPDRLSHRIRLVRESSGLNRLILKTKFAIRQPKPIRTDLIGRLFPETS